MYYIIETEYIGPKNSRINPIRNHFYDIRREPGKTNMTSLTSLEGWLGTTDGWSRHAHGAYQTLEEAREALLRLLPDEWVQDEELDALDVELYGVVERYYPTRYVGIADPAYWFEPLGDDDEIRKALGITAETTDEQLYDLAKREQEEAYWDDRLYLDGLEEYLEGVRKEAREEASA